MPFPHVFSPIRLRHRTLSSRITFGAHTANMSEGGLPGERHVAYYRERAIGGASMIVVEPVPVHRTAVLTRGNFRHDDDAVIPAFRRLVDACREVAPEIVLIQQLYHVGEHGDADNSFAANWSPSGLPSYHDADGSHAMSSAEIHEVIEGFVAAAARAQAAGFDGVEIFAAYHGLIDQFWTPWSNRRDDDWGGSFDGRMRFSSTILGRIRERCGDDFIIGLAVSVDEGSEATLSVEELQSVVAWHDERRLMDYVTCGTGSYFDFYQIIPVSLYPQRLGAPYAAALKAVVRNSLVQAESHIRTPEAAEAVLAAGQADLVSIVRGQIADPHLVAKARDDRADEVRPCISCNQLCWGRRSRDYWISCLVNPSAGREFEWGGEPLPPTSAARDVLVVGGGPAGLEAARVAAERGHRVTLVERGDHLGGQFRLAARQPSREQIGELLAWYERTLGRLGVDVRLGLELDASGVAAIVADAVVVATGARPARAGFQRAAPMVDRLPGVDAEDVFAIHDVLDGVPLPGSRVIVLDDLGDWRGTGTALMLAETGHEVTLVTAAPVIAGGLAHSAADGPLRRRFVAAGGTALPNVVVERWGDGSARLRFLLDGTTIDFEADALVIAETAVSETTLADQLRQAGVPFELIGDAVAPRRASLAFYEGRELARRL
ncbi:MAG TPA: FAD-dependent oxidoreductase [Candidatus Limnocylindrales bacterium]|jgi:2,4-dienoyl-CoA reductase-like NADH-dependent reductase (Old Yellow Enzyme family)|nr:FAD-dependent oxidoreductase [Candidatus Limnocylindrales bacterium]